MGSGLSRVSCALAKEGIKTIGIDISPSAIESAKELLRIEGVTGFLVNGDILHTPFKDDFKSENAAEADKRRRETAILRRCMGLNHCCAAKAHDTRRRIC